MKTRLLSIALLLCWLSAALAANPGLNFTRIADYYNFPSAWFVTVLADVNHDGKPDLIRSVLVAAGGPYGVSVQLGNGQGTFGAPTTYATDFLFPLLKVVDLNNDGHMDIVVVRQSDDAILVFRGNGDGTFQNPVTTVGPFHPTGIAFTDFNKDGKLDLIMCGYTQSPFEGSVTHALGNGDGTFSSFSTFYTSDRTAGVSSASVAVGDFNGDGWPDFVVSNTTGLSAQGTISTFLNLKNNTFARQREVAIPGRCGELTIADLNGDGKADLIYVFINYDNIFGGSPPGNNIGVALGNGNGTFGNIVETGTLVPNMDAPIYSMVAGATNFYLSRGTNVVAADMDGDGDLDLVAAYDNVDAAESFIGILRNNGSGGFASARQLPVNYRTGYVSVGDLEGDGSRDILATKNDSTNQTYLSTASPPVITSPSSATFTVGQFGTFTFTATGVPKPTFTVQGATWPTGVSMTADGVLSGTPAAGTARDYLVNITASNGASPSSTQSFTLTVTTGAPTVTNPSYDSLTNNSARMYGTVTSDNGFALTRRGIVYSRTSVNATPRLGGNGVTAVDDPQVTLGTFSRTATGLNASTSYSFAAFATNTQATGYSPVATFQTNPPPGAGSLVVTTTVDENNGNADPANGTGTSLREAVAYASALGGDRTITFSPNLFANGPATITLSAPLNHIFVSNLSGTTTIDGPGANMLTINGNKVARVFWLEGGALRLNGMTVANGLPQGSNDGGGVRGFGTLYVNDCVFSGNNGGKGGAIYVGGAAYITRSTFMNNSATAQGGAIANESTILWITNCTFSGNTADQGGAFYNSGSGAQARLVNCTLANNTATTAGGGVAMQSSNTVFAQNTIVSGNTAPSGANVSGTLNGFGLTSSLIDADPAAIFTTGMLANNGGTTPTIALKPGGSAINAGTNSLAVDNTTATLATDQRGRTRIANTTVDIGAYEALESLVVNTTADENNGTSDSGVGAGTSLREALAYANSLGGASTITFAPALAGQTITVVNGWSDANDDTTLRVLGNVTVDGGTGVTINLAAPGARRIFLNSGVLTLRNLKLSGGNVQGSNDGGALWSNGTATLEGVQFTNNKANYGGAVESNGTLNVRNCTFNGNYAQFDGGGLHAGSGPSLTIDNSTFSGNGTGTVASAIASGAQQNTYRFLTVANNSGGAGAIDINQYPLTMVNSIVAGNAPDGIMTSNGGGFSAQSTNNILGSGATGGLTNATNGNQTGVAVIHLLLGALASNGGPTETIAISPGSLAADAGVAISGLTSDQLGTARPQGGAVDVGAYELVPSEAAAIPIVDPLGGTYQDSVQVSIASTSANSIVRYTLDGSAPSSSSGLTYSGPFTLTRGTTAIKAIAYGHGWLGSPVASTSYTVLMALPYWRNVQGLAADGSQDLLNPSRDGVANLLKYAFNLAANAGDLNRPNAVTLPANGIAGLPRVGHDGQGRLTMQFVRRKAASNAGISYIVETSPDLLNWSPVDLTNANITSIDSTWERVTVTDPTVAPKRFGRVRLLALDTYFNDFNAALGAATLYGSAAWTNAAVQLTDTVDGVAGSVIFNGITLGSYNSGFTVRFNLQLGPTTTGVPADGASFAVGTLPNAAWGETGPSGSHSIAVGFDTFDNSGNGTIGIHLWVNGTHVASNPLNPFTDGASVPVEVSYDATSGMTVKFNGTTVLNSVALSGFSFQPNDRFGFGARTGGANERAIIDNVEIVPR